MKKTSSTKSNILKTQKLTKKDTFKQNQDLDYEIPTQMTITSESKSENVRVAVRVRPMNELQKSRGDTSCLKLENDGILQINHKGVFKGYKFNYLLDQNFTQQMCYKNSCVNQLLDAAIEGYSATVFAYGQTGSGKTYTMAGKEEIFNRQVYKTDQRQGIIPRAIQQLWKKIKQQKSKFSVKASYTQIYNQQIKDLLNLQSGVLHCRWNPTNGFFVEDLIVVDCSNVDDMISVLHEGMKNRKSGSHEMNKDSSRSHSILTLYIISQVKGSGSGTQTTKKYGKISFVDLAGSQRLKQSKSEGVMIKQTGNINKSLFTLGKVIKGLTDKKSKAPYIPYRDSKLTMLLMDSLGGNSKALMIACTSPSSLYFDQTLSTLNYAARTMNIRNKPVIQMDQKEQIIGQIQSEIEALRKENIYLREQYQRVNKGLPIKMPELGKNDMIRTFKFQGGGLNSQFSQLPPLQKDYSVKGESGTGKRPMRPGKNDTDTLIVQFQLKFQQIKKQNQSMRKHKQQSQQMYRKLMDTNTSIQNKLQNLQQIFLNKKKNQNTQNEIITSSLLTQNTELKKKLRQVEKQKIQLGFQKIQPIKDSWGILKRQNSQIQKQIQKLQNKEKMLLEELQNTRK